MARIQRQLAEKIYKEYKETRKDQGLILGTFLFQKKKKERESTRTHLLV